MKTSMKTAALAGVMLVLVPAAGAAEDRPDGRALFRRMDINQDRRLQFAEVRQMRGEIFDRIDIDGNGVLAAAERDAALAARPEGGQGMALMLEAGAATGSGPDADADGIVTRDEFVAYVPDRLRMADSNGDGALSMFEMGALRRK